MPVSSGRVLQLFVLLALIGGLPPDSRAEIVWKQKVIALQANAKSTVLEARFPFTNAGPGPVDITQVESSCGCTVVSLDKRHYEAGEGGEIVARLYRRRRGRHAGENRAGGHGRRASPHHPDPQNPPARGRALAAVVRAVATRRAALAQGDHVRDRPGYPGEGMFPCVRARPCSPRR